MRKFGKFFSLAAVLAGTLATAGQAAAQGHYVFIENPATHLVWDVSDHGTQPGTAILAYPRNGGDNQQWTVRNVGHGVFEIRGKESGLCAANIPSEGADLTIEDCGRLESMWRRVPLEGGYVLYENMISRECATVSEASAPVTLQSCNRENPYQQFKEEA